MPFAGQESGLYINAEQANDSEAPSQDWGACRNTGWFKIQSSGGPFLRHRAPSSGRHNRGPCRDYTGILRRLYIPSVRVIMIMPNKTTMIAAIAGNLLLNATRQEKRVNSSWEVKKRMPTALSTP